MNENMIYKGQTTAGLSTSSSNGAGGLVNRLIPFASGFYVGVAHGKNISINSTAEIMLLAFPTGFSLLVSVLSTHLIRGLAKDPADDYAIRAAGGLYDEFIKTPVIKLDDLANQNMPLHAARATVRAGLMTALGYALGYGCAKTF